MPQPVKLAVNRVDEARRKQARELFEEYMKEPTVESAFVLVERADRSWSWAAAGNTTPSNLIGQLTVSIQELVQDHIDHNKRD